MITSNIYLNFKGNCEEAFTFYKHVFQKEFTMMERMSSMPEEQCKALSEKELNLIMHVSLPLDGDSVLMGCDLTGEYATYHQGGNNFSISLNVDTKEEADRIFTELSAGGQIMMPIADTFWGSYFGMFTDKFGIGWMVSVDIEPK